jgi:hypothetical protein
MVESTRPATWDDLLQLARDLAAEGARYALIGGYAIAAHGYNRFSEDLDLLGAYGERLLTLQLGSRRNRSASTCAAKCSRTTRTRGDPRKSGCTSSQISRVASASFVIGTR